MYVINKTIDFYKSLWLIDITKFVSIFLLYKYQLLFFVLWEIVFNQLILLIYMHGRLL
jgi:hypothetical protein